MPHKVMQVKVGNEWTTLGRVTEEGARKYVALTGAGITALEACPSDLGERAGKTLTVTASYVRNNAETCRVALEKDAVSVDDQKAETEAAKPAKKATKKKATAKSD